jgi:hypothetical protein
MQHGLLVVSPACNLHILNEVSYDACTITNPDLISQQ